MTPFEVADDLFEDETVKTFILANIWFAGWAPDYESMGDLVPTFLGLCNHMYLPGGGTIQLSHTLSRIVAYYGGKIFVNAPVKKILVDNNGKASGVSLGETNNPMIRGDREISARKAIVSATDVTTTFLELLDESALDQDFRKKVERFDYRGNALFNVHYELDEAPRYKTIDKTIDLGWSQDIGYENYGVSQGRPQVAGPRRAAIDSQVRGGSQHTLRQVVRASR